MNWPDRFSTRTLTLLVTALAIGALVALAIALTAAVTMTVISAFLDLRKRDAPDNPHYGRPVQPSHTMLQALQEYLNFIPRKWAWLIGVGWLTVDGLLAAMHVTVGLSWWGWLLLYVVALNVAQAWAFFSFRSQRVAATPVPPYSFTNTGSGIMNVTVNPPPGTPPPRPRIRRRRRDAPALSS